MIIKETKVKAKRGNRSIVLHLENTLLEYQANYAQNVTEIIRRVEIADSINWGRLADGHREGCPRQLHFTHHDSYVRSLKHYDGSQSSVNIHRVRCLECGVVFTILPSFVLRYKRYDADAVEKFMTTLFITEDSYRMASVGQALGMDTQRSGTWAALENAKGVSIEPRALWGLAQWMGQLSPAQLNLAFGIEPPTHIIEDEKHLTQNGEKAYAPIIYAPQEALIWWIDYIQSVSSEALQDSFERFKTLSERFSNIVGATVDGWDAAQEALRLAFPGMTLQECLFHATHKLGVYLATYKRQCKAAGRPISAQEEEAIFQSFVNVLYAPTQEAYELALQALPDAFNQGPLASRKQSLQTKQALFQAWLTDKRLALVTTALDQCMKFLNRKQDNMQTLRGEKSGLATMNAWAITRNCWRFLKGAKRAGLSPIELAGANLASIPWMQWVNLVLCAWPTIALAAHALTAST
ncbi:MAG: DUF6431 domain-containing protein [Desulfobulbaceae bacterium]|nr:DUF6431 domain-containing protein [Desulfobulbaceae bacterium]